MNRNEIKIEQQIKDSLKWLLRHVGESFDILNFIKIKTCNQYNVIIYIVVLKGKGSFMEDELYTIGKMASIMGISIQTLRYYEKIGLVEPCYISPESGYRFYNYDQFHKIDRIRYFQKLGMSLNDITEIYKSGNTNEIISHLKEQYQREQENLLECQKKLINLKWYIDYFSFYKHKRFFNIIYMKSFPKQWAMLVDIDKDTSIPDINRKFYSMKNSEPFQNMEYFRQNVAVLNIEEILKGKHGTTRYGVYLQAKPKESNPHYVEFPEGEYLCFLSPVYCNEPLWIPEGLEKIIKQDKKYLVIADEYEDNLFRYDKSIHEIRIMEI